MPWAAYHTLHGELQSYLPAVGESDGQEQVLAGRILADFFPADSVVIAPKLPRPICAAGGRDPRILAAQSTGGPLTSRLSIFYTISMTVDRNFLYRNTATNRSISATP